jgi:putative heme-binding domain-containing protein
MKKAVLKVVKKTKGTPQFVELVREFKLKGQGEELLKYALKYPGESSGVEAFRMAAEDLGNQRIKALLGSNDSKAAIQLIGASNDKKLIGLLHPVVSDMSVAVATRKGAVQALAHNQEGAKFLLKLAKDDQLPADLKLLASSELNFAPWPEVKKSAADLLPLPESQNAQPLPPISRLVKVHGDPEKGAEVFGRATVGCINCHQVNGKGADFGPNLSEIGTKLGKDALFEAILDPSAGISFGFEGWNIELKNGDELTGIITSETADEISLKSQNGITTRCKKSDIAKRQKLTLSFMPAGLQLTMSQQELVDLVAYLSTLKKK